MATCPNCQQPIHPKARLCLSCGAPIPQKGGTRLWQFTQIMSVIGALIVVLGVASASGAPQEASAAAIGIACAVIPYCLARATSERRDRQ